MWALALLLPGSSLHPNVAAFASQTFHYGDLWQTFHAIMKFAAFVREGFALMLYLRESKPHAQFVEA